MPRDNAHGTVTDTRIVACSKGSWWGAIGEVAVSGRGLPLCPFCHAPLFEWLNEAAWNHAVERYLADCPDPLYRDYLTYCRTNPCRPASTQRRFFDLSRNRVQGNTTEL